jgi:uncharacterized peroxidase-related enzyme
MSFIPSLHERASLIDVFRAFPETSKPLIEFHEVLLRGPSPFTEGERELIASYVSGLNDCRYCCAVHTATTERLGVEPGVVRALLAARSEVVPEKMRPVLEYARKLTDEPASVTRADAEAVMAAGWNETALYHTVAVTALFNFMNRLVEGLGIELDPAYVEPASRRLAERGYLPLLEMIRR